MPGNLIAVEPVDSIDRFVEPGASQAINTISDHCSCIDVSVHDGMYETVQKFLCCGETKTVVPMPARPVILSKPLCCPILSSLVIIDLAAINCVRHGDTQYKHIEQQLKYMGHRDAHQDFNIEYQLVCGGCYRQIVSAQNGVVTSSESFCCCCQIKTMIPVSVLGVSQHKTCCQTQLLLSSAGGVNVVVKVPFEGDNTFIKLRSLLKGVNGSQSEPEGPVRQEMQFSM